MAQAYEVKRILETPVLTEQGELKKVYRHTILTKGGVLLTVDIAEADFTPEKAAPILAKRAVEADKILAL